MSVPSSSIEDRNRSPIGLVIILVLFITSGLLLTYLLHDVDWELVRQSSPVALVLILVATVLGTLVYTLLIYLLVRGSGYFTTLWRAYLVLTASLSANYITPIKVGIPLRIYLYNHFFGIPVATGTALVTVEALVGILVPAFIAIVGIILLFPSLGLLTPIVLIAILLATLALVFHIEYFQPYLRRLPFSHFTNRIIHFVERVQSELRCLSLVTVFGVVVLDLLMLGLQAWRLWLVLSIFGTVPSPLTLLAVLTISVTAGNLSMLPMGLGVRDASFTLLLIRLGVPDTVALSAAVIQRLFSPGWPLLLGLVSTNILGIKELVTRFGNKTASQEGAHDD